MASSVPYFEATKTSKQLIVDGKPMLLLAAELQNSSMTSPSYMIRVWPNLVDSHINTVLGCVTWEQIEPEEGHFDFAVLDRIIADARRYGLRLVLLWFGSFKNGQSTYCPSWVKRDSKRFPRARLRKAGGELKIADVLSIFHNEARDADARAFAKLLAHLKEVDEHHTVIMVQVENEVGLLGDSRDGSAAATKIFEGPVPLDLVAKLRDQWDQLRPELQDSLSTFRAQSQPTGSWQQVFGKSKQTDEIFMAYHYAQYVEYVAAAGKVEYAIPLYTNVWLRSAAEPGVAGGGAQPGDYPSGGGVFNVLDIWQLYTPSLEFIAPDIYLNDYELTCEQYRHRNQPLFIPEQRRDEYGARRIWKAFGSFQAIGTSPFGIDTVHPDMDIFERHYRLLSNVSVHVLSAQREERSFGFFFDRLSEDGIDHSPALRTKFGDWDLFIQRSFVFGRPGPGFGMVIHLEGAQFRLVGFGFQVTFTHQTAPFTGILKCVEMECVDAPTGMLKELRMLNGDETRSGATVVMPNEDPDYGGFPISITIPGLTGIADCELYSLEADEA